MALSLPTASRTAMASALVELLDAGAGPGVIEIRSGTRPAVDSAASGTVLATVVLKNPAFSVASGVATIDDPDAVTGVSAGTATWFRALDADDSTVFDGSVGATGSDSDLELATTTISVGLSVDITGGTITMPGS